ncbi:MAG: SIR2 family protein [Bacteroidales bacterium]|nr:SIR2 family protein [Bacteroidales bacterium]
MNLFLLGAGASKSYIDSPTKVKMPIAKDFFKTFHKLRIAENRWVLIGDITNYLKDFHNIPWTGFLTYNEDIEILHSEVEEKLNQLFEKKENIFNSTDNTLIYKTYIQLIFVFASVINEIQNGPPSASHLNLAKNLTKEDIIITFNWDTLMDRALKQTSNWNADNGYLVKPTKVYRDQWIEAKDNQTKDYPIILKLHGSTNWLTSCLRSDGDKLKSLQEIPIDDFYIYESTINPYNTFKGRFMSGYADYSYGYYPPNLPLIGEKIPDGYLLINFAIILEGMPEATASSEGLVSMPLIIPPVKCKNYSYFGNIFSQLWNKAEESLVKADRIIIIGYSFPATDTQTDTLFKRAFNKRRNTPEVIIIDPMPENIYNRFIFDYGIKANNITTHKTYFNQDFDVNSLFK